MSKPKDSTSAVIFSVTNHHVPGCGTPPTVTDEPSTEGHALYLSYFQNQHGEQWILKYDRNGKTGVLYGGDLQWDKPIAIGTEWPEKLVLDAHETFWLAGALMAAGAITEKEFSQQIARGSV